MTYMRDGGARQGAHGGVDWDGEGRGCRDRWLARVVAPGVVLVALVALLAWYVGAATPLGALLWWACVCAGAGAVAVLTRRRTARRIGVAPGHVLVLARRIRTGQVPDDPGARRAMAALAARLRRQVLAPPWVWPLLLVLYLALAGLLYARHDEGVALVWLCVCSLTLAPLALYRPAKARLDRVESGLVTQEEHEAGTGR